MEAIPHAPPRVEYLATLAHELRSPLAAIQAAVRVLDNQTASNRKEARALIDRQVLRIARLSDDLLDAGYLASGQPELHKEVVDLRTSSTLRPKSAALSSRRGTSRSSCFYHLSPSRWRSIRCECPKFSSTF